jgi:hypothetical protein
MSGIKRGGPKGNGRYSSGGASRAEIKEHPSPKQIIKRVAEELGGVNRLLAWARRSKRNEDFFWCNIYTKLLKLPPDPSDQKLTEPLSKDATEVLIAKLRGIIDARDAQWVAEVERARAAALSGADYDGPSIRDQTVWAPAYPDPKRS